MISWPERRHVVFIIWHQKFIKGESVPNVRTIGSEPCRQIEFSGTYALYVYWIILTQHIPYQANINVNNVHQKTEVVSFFVINMICIYYNPLVTITVFSWISYWKVKEKNNWVWRNQILIFFWYSNSPQRYWSFNLFRFFDGAHLFTVKGLHFLDSAQFRA